MTDLAAVPFCMSIKKARDLLHLEKALRELLRCEGRTCTFLQSSVYARLKFEIQYALRHGEDRKSVV